jgi:hypothetical protein
LGVALPARIQHKTLSRHSSISSLPFSVFSATVLPELSRSNEETIEAMRAARRGELVTVGSADNLLEILNAGD